MRNITVWARGGYEEFIRKSVWVGYIIFIYNVMEVSVVVCRVMHEQRVKAVEDQDFER